MVKNCRIVVTHLVMMLFLSGILTACEKPAVDDLVTIAEIQGCSHRSPYSDQMVSGVTGIVTAKAYNGFYMQSEEEDGLNCTSEGIFVFTEDYQNVIPGDKVLVNGKVEEFLPGKIEDKNLTITEIVDPQVRTLSTGNQLPDHIVIGSENRVLPDQTIDNDRLRSFDFGEDGIDYYESLESMLVRVSGGIVVGPRNAYNEVVVIPLGYQKLNSVSSSGALLQRENDANPERLILNLNSENKQKVNIGAVLKSDVIGVMDYSYGNFKIKAFGKVDFSETTTEETVLDIQQGKFTLVTYNVENLSLQDEEAKFRAVASDILNDLSAPDLVILHEVMDDSGIENDATVSANRTVNRLIDDIIRLGGPQYVPLMIDPENNQDGGISGGNIRSVILYKAESGIKLVDNSEDFGLLNNPTTVGPAKWPFSVTRKPLVALFDWKGQKLLVAAVHLTSRGLDSPLFGSVQPIERLEEEKRVAQAEYLNKYLANFHASNPEINIILAGDINDDPWSTTLSALTSTTLFDAGETIERNERFSYILDGNAVQLDYILVSEPRIVSQYSIPHLNSIFDHHFQVSDHDPVFLEIDLTLKD